jgi:1-acyl-sn-glycerol-3-phosphate acyltransferase
MWWVLLALWLMIGYALVRGLERNIKLLEFCMQINAGKIPIPNDWRPFPKFSDPPLPSRFVLYSMAFTLAPLRLLVFIAMHVLVFGLVLVPSERIRRKLIHLMASTAALSLGVRVRCVGKRDVHAPCVVANHGGGFDGLMILSSGIPLHFVARAETGRIFILGAVIRRLGAIFIQREADDARMAGVDAINKFLKSWKPYMSHLLIFPEGTTNNQTHLLPFKSGAFRSGTPVQPFRAEYSSSHHIFTCNDDLLGYLATLVCLPSISELKLTWLPTLTPITGETPEAMADRAAREISMNGEIFRMGFGGYRQHREFQKFLATNGM